MVVLIQPYSGKELTVHEDHAEFWRGLGYRDVEADKGDSKPEPARKTATAKKTAAAKGEDK